MKDNCANIMPSRGKKVFRRFADIPPTDTTSTPIADSVLDPDYQAEVTRRIGDAARRPLPRSGVRPKRLFEDDLKAAAEDEEALTEADEEAETDIEIRRVDHVATVTATPRKIAFWGLATPPTTGKRERKLQSTVVDVPMPMSNQPDRPIDQGLIEGPLCSQSKKSPFDKWYRTKSASAEASAGGKRAGEPEEGAVSKRLRSAAGSRNG